MKPFEKLQDTTDDVNSSILPSNKTWKPLPLKELSSELKGFDDWVLCGGFSIELLTGKSVRSHGDVDIGVFRSQAEACLSVLGQQRGFLCKNKKHYLWDGQTIPPDVHDIWVTDKNHKYWMLQIMVFDDDSDQVIYRRNPKITWSKEHHFLDLGWIKVLNPYVTFLFKANRPQLEEKDIKDIMLLISHGVSVSFHQTKCENSTNNDIRTKKKPATDQMAEYRRALPLK